MDNSKKSEQNKSYYQRNKEKILERARSRTARPAKGLQLVPFFEDSPKAGAKKKKSPSDSSFNRRLGLGLLFLLVLSMTGFLIHESAKFFADSSDSMSGAYFKALLLEGAAIAFSLMRGRTLWLGCIYKLAVVLAYSYGVWVVSEPILDSTLMKHDEIVLHQKAVQEIETEIAKKEAVRDQLWAKDRMNTAQKYDLSLASLKEKLDLVRSEKVQTQNVEVIRHHLWESIGFRIFIIFANFLFLQFFKDFLTFDEKYA